MHTHSRTIKLIDDKIFETLGQNFIELKTITIKDNNHINKNGKATFSMIDHYCYAEMEIYINQDRIITDRIKDHSFDNPAIS